VSLTTNENASCQYAASSGVAYGNSSATAFTTGQGTMSHSFNATGLLSGVPYSYWVRCQDSLGNANTSDTLISFSVGTPAVAVTSPSGGEAWNVGETHSVTWTAVGASNVKLYITDSNIVGSGNVDYITPDGGSVSASSGSYSWVVGTPHAILPGSNYRIRIDAVDSNGNVLTNGSGAEIRAFSANVFSVSQAAVVSNNNDSSSHKDDKKETPSRTVTNSKKTAVRGDILTQRGKKFSKNTIVQLYFAKPGGGYYPPQSVKTSSTGSFVVTYKVNKPKGKYGWYVFDTKTSKKSKIVYYSVK
jgi:hypothetical protein